jgi:excisionase family DNA binding protein
MTNSTGNAGLDALVDAIANRMVARLQLSQDSRLLSVREAAEYLGRTEKSLRHMIANSIIPAVREGTRVQLDRSDLDRWIEMRKSTA